MQDEHEQTKWQRGDLVQLKCGGPCMVVRSYMNSALVTTPEVVVHYASDASIQQGVYPEDILVPWVPVANIEEWKAQCGVECAAKQEAGAHVLTARRLLTTARNLVITSKLPGFEAKINQFLWDTEHYQKDADG